MSHCEFNVADIRQHRRGIHMPEVRFEPTKRGGTLLGELVLFGRSIPVVSPEQLESRLKQIGCNEEITAEIVGNLFGFRVATEAPVALTELVESFV